MTDDPHKDVHKKENPAAKEEPSVEAVTSDSTTDKLKAKFEKTELKLAQKEDKEEHKEDAREKKGHGKALDEYEIRAYEIGKKYDLPNHPENVTSTPIDNKIWGDPSAGDKSLTPAQEMFNADMGSFQNALANDKLSHQLNAGVKNPHMETPNYQINDAQIAQYQNMVQENAPAFKKYENNIQLISNLPYVPALTEHAPEQISPAISSPTTADINAAYKEGGQEIKLESKERLLESQGKGQILDKNETRIFDIGQKYDMLNHPEVVQNRPIKGDGSNFEKLSAADQTYTNDMHQFRSGLEQKGMHTTNSPTITSGELASYKTVLYENTPAILQYQEALVKENTLIHRPDQIVNDLRSAGVAPIEAPTLLANPFANIDLGKHGAIGFQGADTAKNVTTEHAVTTAPTQVNATHEVIVSKAASAAAYK